MAKGSLQLIALKRAKPYGYRGRTLYAELKKLKAEGEQHGHYSQVDDYVYAFNDPKSWYLNHSCEPNCWMKDRVVVAMRTIEPAYDYGLVEINMPWRFNCKCGSKKCRKIVSYMDFIETSLVKRNEGFVPDYVKERSKNFSAAHRRNHIIKRKLCALGLYAYD